MPRKKKFDSVPIDSVFPDPSNVRRHGDQNLKAIAASLQKFGQVDPLIIDANNIILAGNARWGVMKDLGFEKVQVLRTELTGSEAIAFAIAHNRTSELAEWDFPELNLQLAALEEEGWDLDDMGFDLDALDDLTDDAPARDHDESVATSAGDPFIKIGEIQFRIPHEQYLDLLEDLREAYGWSEDELVAGVKQRLKIK